jgi:hypothetical protein
VGLNDITNYYKMQILTECDIVDYLYFLSFRDVINLTRLDRLHNKVISAKIQNFLLRTRQHPFVTKLSASDYFVAYYRGKSYGDDSYRGRSLNKQIDTPFVLPEGSTLLSVKEFREHTEQLKSLGEIWVLLKDTDVFIANEFNARYDSDKDIYYHNDHDITVVLSHVKSPCGKFQLHIFYSEVGHDECTPDYYGFDSDDFDINVLHATITCDTHILNIISNYPDLQCILDDVLKVGCCYGVDEILNESCIPSKYKEVYIQCDKTNKSKPIATDVEPNKVRMIYKVPKFKKQIEINVEPYYRIYIDDVEYLTVAMKAALQGKQVYIGISETPNECYNISKLDIDMLKCCIKLHDISNIHIVDINFNLHNMDLIIMYNVKASYQSMIINSPYHPDIISYSVEIKDYVRDKLGDSAPMYTWYHISRCNKEIRANYILNNGNYEDASKYGLLLKPQHIVDKLIEYRNGDKSKGVPLIEYAVKNNMINDAIVFESYIILWYLKGSECAEQFIWDHLDKVVPNLSSWKINWQFLSEPIRTALVERSKETC